MQTFLHSIVVGGHIQRDARIWIWSVYKLAHLIVKVSLNLIELLEHLNCNESLHFCVIASTFCHNQCTLHPVAINWQLVEQDGIDLKCRYK